MPSLSDVPVLLLNEPNKAQRNPGGRSKEKLFRLISKISFLLLFQFFACLFLIFAAEAVAGILGFLYRDRVGIFVVVLISLRIFLVLLTFLNDNPSIFQRENKYLLQ